ncbi:MAG TPA: family 78 glycoside hydrolase catalytic domain, partial [Prolixibacteraceae bacterium]|nr:family 78 glycoside hydrolase catalytic domain [Prolixibacteraceae bacterium]
MTRLFVTLPLFFVLVFSGFTCSAVLNVYNLRCENLSNPLGVNTYTPRLSWKIKSNKNGTEQKAYQLMVASDPFLLNNGEADLWDSGRTESSSTVLVSYRGVKLSSGSVAYWKIRIWDESGNASPWSPVASFSIGLLNKEDWQASYIGFPTNAGSNQCPQLKKSFLTDNEGDKLCLHVNSLGYHEVYINGMKVGDGVLSPAVSQFNKRSLVITYEISSMVKKSRNDLVLWLGSGWYRDSLPGVTGNGPLVKAQLEKISGSKRQMILATDSTWLGRKSSYSRVSSGSKHHLGGEAVDGTLAKYDLLTENADGTGWSPVSVVSVPVHEVSPQMAEQNRITETILPVEIRPLSQDTFLVDMGKNLTGWTEVHFSKLKKSQEIVLEYSDHLDESGKFVNQRQKDCYIASGEGSEVFKNKFNYHGYRYIRISNLKESPSSGSIKAYLIHTDYDLASDFECSDPELNKIHDMIFYTLRCLSIGGDLVDCPQIERLGYGGDGNASTVTAQTMFNLAPMYANWMQAWADCIREDGSMPHTAPNPFSAGGGPYWCGFIITASWNTYLNYGDSLILKKYYPTMQKWLGYVDKYSVNGLLKPWPETAYRSWFLGDWATPAGIDQKAEASVGLVNNCFVEVCLETMQKIATVLGKPADAELYL